MDNDNKINNKNVEDLHNQVMLFLGDEVDKIHQKSSNNSYDIETEYAKTKKNHSPVNFLVLFGAFLIVIGTVFFINKYISAKDQEITVSLNEFEDLNLNNLLNTVATAQTNYDNALETKHLLEAEMEAKLNNLKADLDNEIFVLDSLNLSNKQEYRNRKSKAQSKYDSEVANVKKEYESQIILATKQVESYKEQLDEFDSVKVANAQEKEKLLNSERQLRKIEIDKVTKSYEEKINNLNSTIDNIRAQHSAEMRDSINNVVTKYQGEIDALDPKLTDIKANLILSTVVAEDDFNGPFQLVSSNIDNPEIVKSVKKYQNLYDDYKYLDDAVKAIPQKNSIPSYVAAAHSLVNNMSNQYIESSKAYYNHIVEQNNQITEKNNQIAEKNNQIDNLNNTIEQQNIKYETDMAEAKQTYENNLNQEKENHAAEMAAADAAHAEELKANSDSYENKIKTNNENYEKNLKAANDEANATLSRMFKFLGCDVVLINAAGYENIQVSVNPEKQALIPAEGIAAVINLEIPVNGKVLQNNGSYYFEVEKDEEGNPIPVDFEQLVSGTPVELIFQ